MRAGEFKAKCLELMDSVAESGGVIVITKRGKPLAQLSAVASRAATLVGYLKEQIDFVGDAITPVDVDWGPDAPPPRQGTAQARQGATRVILLDTHVLLASARRNARRAEGREAD